MQEASSVRAHRPDAVVRVDDGRRVAVEVELTLKSRARMERIVGRLLTDYDAVWYFAAPAPGPRAHRAGGARRESVACRAAAGERVMTGRGERGARDRVPAWAMTRRCGWCSAGGALVLGPLAIAVAFGLRRWARERRRRLAWLSLAGAALVAGCGRW